MNCPICKSHIWNDLFPSQDRLYEISGKFSVVVCRKCGLWRLEPLLTQSQVSRYYPKQYYSYLGNNTPGFFWRLRTYIILHQQSQNIFHRLLGYLFPVPAIPTYTPNGKIMDIGCGSGETLSQLSHIGWNGYGLDIDRDAIKLAKKRGLSQVRFGSYEDLKQYPDNFFDVVRLYFVIEHLVDPAGCLRVIHKKMKKHGVIIVGTGNTASVAARIFGTYWCHLDSPRHLFVFSIENLSKLVKSNGYTIKKTYCSSAGGIVCSIQYVVRNYCGWKLNLIGNPFIVALFYPLERVLDLVQKGDTFVIEAAT